MTLESLSRTRWGQNNPLFRANNASIRLLTQRERSIMKIVIELDEENSKEFKKAWEDAKEKTGIHGCAIVRNAIFAAMCARISEIKYNYHRRYNGVQLANNDPEVRMLEAILNSEEIYTRDF
jgi:hypothetical protein